ncbi:PAS domain-containing protein [Streptomyces sp. NPDC057136]|uniref:PAS domain-containing protein n=1 Tax=Streptomyces sp. NPDC057136 TaxID=3346029 RepID=UPI00362625F2
MTQSEDFGSEFRDFAARVEELRAARARPDSERSVLLDAALLELQHVVDDMRPAYEEFASRVRGATTGVRAEQLFKAIFENIPVPVALVDGETVMRRINAAAADLTGLPVGYAAGRPLSGILRPGDRPALRSQTAAVARGEGSRSLSVHLQSRTGSFVRVTLTEVLSSGDTETAVLVTLWPTSTQATGHPPEATPTVRVAVRAAELTDLMDRTTRVLLGGRAHDPAEVLRSVTGLIRDGIADWAVLDLLVEGELTRSAVHGPEGNDDPGLEKTIVQQDPRRCPVVVGVVSTGSVVLDGLAADLDRLGVDDNGAPLAGRADVGSLLAVPLSAQVGEPPVRGVLTLLRTGARPSFSMAEAACVETIVGHMAIVAEALADGATTAGGAE